MAITFNSLLSDARLGIRMLFILPIQKLMKPPGGEQFAKNFFPEGLVPTSLADRQMLGEASRCIGCGLCDSVAGSGPRPSLIPTTLSKASADLREVVSDLSAYERDPDLLARAEKLCPTGVPLVRLEVFLRERERRLAPLSERA